MIISDMVDVGSIDPRDLPALGLSGAFGIGGVSLGINEKGETNMNKLGFTYTVTTSSGTVEMEIGRQTLLRFIAAITYTQQNCLDGCD